MALIDFVTLDCKPSWSLRYSNQIATTRSQIFLKHLRWLASLSILAASSNSPSWKNLGSPLHLSFMLNRRLSNLQYASSTWSHCNDGCELDRSLAQDLRQLANFQLTGAEISSGKRCTTLRHWGSFIVMKTTCGLTTSQRRLNGFSKSHETEYASWRLNDSTWVFKNLMVISKRAMGFSLSLNFSTSLCSWSLYWEIFSARALRFSASEANDPGSL